MWRVIVLVCFSLLFEVYEAAQCTEVEYTQDKCRGSSYIKIASQTINKGASDVRITLTGSMREASWHCGNDKESVKWGKSANQIRVNFLSDGTVQWTIYNCDDLSGPVKAGLQCSDEAFSTACPGNANSNVTCVFQVSKSTTFTDTTKTSVQVTGSLAKEIGGMATAEVSATLTKERSVATQIKHKEHTYIIIPAGFKFCSYSDAESVEDKLAPTKFKWQCSTTKFSQTKLDYKGGCTKLKRCDTRICVRIPSASDATAIRFCFLHFIALLTATFMLY